MKVPKDIRYRFTVPTWSIFGDSEQGYLAKCAADVTVEVARTRLEKKLGKPVTICERSGDGFFPYYADDKIIFI